jgi:hypothetical protein
MNLSDLPPHLRGVLVVALLLTIAISAGAFALSYVALDSIASQAGLKWGLLSWVFPFTIDALLVVSELATVAASSVVNPQTGRPESRLLPFSFMLTFGATSIWLNTTRVPGELRFIAAIPPVASICGTILIAFLVKLLARSLGRRMTWSAPPPQMLTAMPAPGPVPGVIYRPDQAPYGMVPPGMAGYGPGPYGQPALYGQNPTWAPSQIQQTGQSAEVLNGASGNGDQAEATKRRQVEAHLATLTPDQLGRLAGLGPKAGARELTPALNGQGLQVSERYVQQILDETLAARRQANDGRGRKR